MKKSIHSNEHEQLRILLKSVRENANLTQTQLSEKLNKPQSFVSKYESGERRLDLIEIAAICSAIGLSLTDFVGKFEAETMKP
ncbi:MAG: helix-turn-helix transcriptional regulator [Magnetococcales bacterium]|nr:helix-turn-helix transcriptional regulator [Magnetococcales bacterium]